MFRNKSGFLRHIDSFLLAAILLFLCFKNYTPGTFLIGWDNLLPELNIFANIKRSFFAVWQEYQGLGLVGGNAHATELIRQLIILPFSLILPGNLIRYLWQFAMLFLGSFGILFGLKKHFKFPPWIALLASLFYLLNFGSIQNFHLPFEPFSTFWGFFPWLIFSLWEYLQKPSRLSTLKLLALNLLAAPSFYIPTVFLIYLLCVFLILLSNILTKHKSLLLSLKTVVLIILINSFWILPFVYFLKNDIGNPRSSFINIMSSEEILQRNQRRGTFPDFLLLRGFYYDYQNNGNFLMSPWLIHFANQYNLICGFGLSVFILAGLFFIFKNKDKFTSERLSLFLIFLLSATALASITFPFNLVNAIFRQFSLFDQVFRAPFTKFIVPAIFVFSALSAYGLKALSSLFSLLKYSKKASTILLITIYCLLIVVFSFPAFNGNYLSPRVRLNLPPEYRELFNYFQNEPENGRITNLPSGNFWGWTDYRFGLTGSGFIWYGLKQPVLDRAFDVWNLKNEQYYWELDNAIQKREPLLLTKVLEKYSVQYVVFDNNIYFPTEKIYAKASLSTLDLLKNIPGLKLEKQFGLISVYKYSDNRSSPFITTNTTLVIPDLYAIKRSTVNIETTPQTQDTQNQLYDKNLLTVNHLPLEPPYQYFNDSENGFIRLADYDNRHLLSWYFGEVGFNQSYLLAIETRHIEGYSLRFNAFQENNRFKFIETKISNSKDWHTSWFLIPAMEEYNFNPGLVLLFQNSSFNMASSVNDIRSIKLYPIPYTPTIDYQSSPKKYLPSTSNIFIHKIIVDNTNNTFSELVLPSSFSSGWLAFYFDGLRPVFLKNHVLIDNWANGWDLPITNYQLPITVYIFFWPQLLQFLGFGLLFVPFALLFKPHRKIL